MLAGRLGSVLCVAFERGFAKRGVRFSDWTMVKLDDGQAGFYPRMAARGSSPALAAADEMAAAVALTVTMPVVATALRLWRRRRLMQAAAAMAAVTAATEAAAMEAATTEPAAAFHAISLDGLLQEILNAIVLFFY